MQAFTQHFGATKKEGSKNIIQTMNNNVILIITAEEENKNKNE